MLHRRKFDFIIIAVAALFYVLMCNWVMTELPHLTWFDFIPKIDKLYNRTLGFSDLFSRYGEHGMLGYNVLFLMNAYFFKLTTFFDVYINDVIVIISGIIFVCISNKLVDNKKISYKVSIILITLIQFTLVQKSSGGMETQVRLGIFFFIISSIFVDSIFVSTKKITTSNIVFACLLIILSINVFGTFYNFSGLPVICIVGFLIILKNKSRIKEILQILITYVFSTVLYIIEYHLFSSSNAVDSSLMFKNLITVLLNPIEIIKSVIAYNASGIFGAATFLDGKISNHIYLWLGLILTLIICFSVYEYFKTKMYKKTYLPLFFIAYSLLVCIFVIVGRADGDWTWCINEWYIIHSKVEYIGVIWILAYSYQNMVSKIIIKRIFIYISAITIICIGVSGNYIEIKRLPSIVDYYESKQKYLFAETIDDLPVDANGNTPLLDNPEKTFEAIQILRKYGLSVYKYHSIYEDYLKMTNKDASENSRIVDSKGIYDDKWIGEQAEIKIYSKSGKLNLTLYSPFTYDGTQKGTLYINDKKYCEYNFEKDTVNISLDYPAESFMALKFVNDFSVVKPPDKRKLCFVINISDTNKDGH